MNLKTHIFILAIASIICLSGCSTASKKQMDQIRRVAYSTQASIEAGRFDLAKKYNDELVRIVPPPNNKIKVNEFKVKISAKAEGIFTEKELLEGSVKYIVLPEGLDGERVIINKSQEFAEIIKSNKDLADSEAENERNLIKAKEKGDAVIVAIHKEISQTKKTNILGWIMGAGSVGFIACLIALGIFFPAAIPLLTSLIGRVVSIFNSLILSINKLIK